MFVLLNLTIRFPLPHYLHIYLFMMEFTYNPSVLGPNDYLVFIFTLYMTSSISPLVFSSPTLKFQLLKFPFFILIQGLFLMSCSIADYCHRLPCANAWPSFKDNHGSPLHPKYPQRALLCYIYWVYIKNNITFLEKDGRAVEGP